MTQLACVTIALALLSASAAAESIEAARSAYSKGDFLAAADWGEALGTSEGHALAARALTIHAHYVAPSEQSEALLERAMRAAETAIGLDPHNAEAYVESARAVGRYSQAIGPMKALREGYPKQARGALERALELDPNSYGPHLSLASWHAEVVARGRIARAMMGANRDTAHSHFQQAFALAPERKVVLIEYARGLQLLERNKRRDQARELLARAIDLPSRNAYEALIHQEAVERLAELDGE